MNPLVSNERGQSSCAPSLQQSLLERKMSHGAVFCSLFIFVTRAFYQNSGYITLFVLQGGISLLFHSPKIPFDQTKNSAFLSDKHLNFKDKLLTAGQEVLNIMHTTNLVCIYLADLSLQYGYAATFSVKSNLMRN